MTTKYATWIRGTESNVYNILEGGYRSGKTTIMILALCRHVANMKKGGLHIVAAESIGLARSILGEGGNGLGIKNYFGHRAKEQQYKGKDALRVDLGQGKVHWFIFVGHSKSNSFQSIRGLTATTATITEGTLAHEKFIEEAIGRTFAAAIDERKIFMDLNPTGARAMVYERFVDPWVEAGANYVNASLYDNPGLSDEQVAAVVSEFDPDSPFYKSMILGQRITSVNRVYFRRTRNNHEGELPPIREWIISVDVGETLSATTFVSLALGTDGKIYAFDAWYHRNGRKEVDDNTFTTKTEYVEHLVEYYKAQRDKMGRIPRYVFLDHDQAFHREVFSRFKQEGLPYQSVALALKENIDERISTVSSLLNNGTLQIVNNDPYLNDALDEAVYDQAEFQKGKLVRLDNTRLAFNPVDVVDALEYGVSYMARMII